VTTSPSRRRRILLAAFLVILVAAVVLPAVAAACPGCKELKSDSDYPGGAASLPKGFYYSVLLMVSAPFAVAGTFVTRIVLARRRRRRELVGLAPPEPPS
jgi:hypothetical protein